MMELQTCQMPESISIADWDAAGNVVSINLIVIVHLLRRGE